ncbi:alpha/beta hydrolase [Stenotrophomonas tumulicola]|uniref:Alpha/beta hydrolase n=1 Tax=Stenotrophomonas tumulicola TaxID=1685415 RepID=A0A7W3IGU8_9GAMM|nr:alpha/beta hydrolase-fold protein [Stenotrophomonas tumulicola]MBA8681172.1 alpha/beta hydrolase [Stenotrophomonas tumulicola]
MFHRPPVFRRAMTFIVLCAFTATATFSSQAQQRNPDQLVGQTVLDAPASSYRFERFVVESADGQRRWRVNLGVPVRPSTALAPVLYALDGNAVAMVLDQPLLAELAASPAPPVLVLIGHDNERRIDSVQRTRDYTAWIDRADDESGQLQVVGGGAHAFLDVIERQVKPEVARRASIDPQRQALWGHSLGGLFVLSSLYTRPAAFQQYVAASPSLWWSQGAPLGDMETQFIDNSAGQPIQLWVMLGGDERSGNRGVRDMANPRVVAHLRRVGGAPSDAAHALAGRLAAVPGLQVQYREFPGLGHGPMLSASFKATLAALYGIADHGAVQGAH